MIAELVGGPDDGAVITVAYPAPSPAPGHPGYLPLGPKRDGAGEPWVYRWQATHTGRRRRCSREECAAGCPDKRRPRPTPRPTTP